LDAQIVKSEKEAERVQKLIEGAAQECESSAVKLSQAEIALKELELKQKQVADKVNKADSAARRAAAETKTKQN